MPTYQYRCTACSRDLEVVQKFSDPTLTVCPTCQGALRKVFNAVGVVFKGSGFYRTDSRTAPDAAGASTSDKGGEKKETGEKKSEPKADSAGSGKDPKGGSNGSGGGTAGPANGSGNGSGNGSSNRSGDGSSSGSGNGSGNGSGHGSTRGSSTGASSSSK